MKKLRNNILAALLFAVAGTIVPVKNVSAMNKVSLANNEKLSELLNCNTPVNIEASIDLLQKAQKHYPGNKITNRLRQANGLKEFLEQAKLAEQKRQKKLTEQERQAKFAKQATPYVYENYEKPIRKL